MRQMRFVQIEIKRLRRGWTKRFYRVCKMLINEIFYSLQGEGLLAGVPSIFIRLAGGPLRCKWCDTKYAWEKTSGTEYTVAEIIRKIQKFKSKFVVITGGEPMMDADIVQLTKSLKDCDKHITIETCGIAYIPDVQCDLMSISPKLSNSVPDDPKLAKIHEDSRLDIAILGILVENYNYQLKFVVDSEADLDEIDQTIKELGNIDLDKVMLMPQASTRTDLLNKSPMIAEICKSSGYNFCQRLQVLLWDNRKGT